MRSSDGLNLCRAGVSDRLEHDKGLFDGPRPLIIGDSRFEDLCLLLLGSNPASAEIEFGAQQVPRRPATPLFFPNLTSTTRITSVRARLSARFPEHAYESR